MYPCIFFHSLKILFLPCIPYIANPQYRSKVYHQGTICIIHSPKMVLIKGRRPQVKRFEVSISLISIYRTSLLEKRCFLCWGLSDTCLLRKLYQFSCRWSPVDTHPRIFAQLLRNIGFDCSLCTSVLNFAQLSMEHLKDIRGYF